MLCSNFTTKTIEWWNVIPLYMRECSDKKVFFTFLVELSSTKWVNNILSKQHSGIGYSGIDYSGIDYSGIDCSGIDYSGIDYSGIDYSGIDYSGIDYSGIDNYILVLAILEFVYSGIDYSGIGYSGIG
jgi:uncharacterized protein YjbI with pentapeptide repeats